MTPKFLATFDDADVVVYGWFGWVGRQAGQFLRGLVGGDGVSSMSICQRDSLRFMLRPCGCQVGMTDRAGWYEKPCGRMIWPSEVVYMAKRRGPSTEPWGTPVARWCAA